MVLEPHSVVPVPYWLRVTEIMSHIQYLHFRRRKTCCLFTNFNYKKPIRYNLSILHRRYIKTSGITTICQT